MPRRVSLGFPFRVLLPLTAAVVALSTWFASGVASAQLARPLEPAEVELPSAATAVDAVIQQGQRFEANGRWADALSHYEEAHRRFPGEPVLAEREDVARLHYSLERRYVDRSYLDAIATMSPDQASGLYLELLRKVNAHFVSPPAWRELAQRGVRSLEIGLTDPRFEGLRRRNGLPYLPEQLTPVCQELTSLFAGRTVEGPEELTAAVSEAARHVEARTGLRQTATLLEFAVAAAGGLDEYSAFLTADQLRDVYSQIEGNFVGLGVELKADQGALMIVHVIPGSPAERAGIADRDRIVAVDGRPTAEMSTDEAASLLTGEEGSYVRVTTVTAGQAPRELTIRREHVDVPSLEGAKIIDAENGVAYVRIPAFQKTTSRDLEAELWKFHRQGMRSLVLDLRGNPGGLLTAAVDVADKFLQEGKIVFTRGRSPQEDHDWQAHYGGTWRVPLVVLIDRDSASASEIFAGAIKDNGRGLVIGEQSYGKGTVQGIFPLGFAGAGIRLTTALFYSPLGQRISHRGITPDRTVQTVGRPTEDGASQLRLVDAGEDLVLQAGVEAAGAAAKARVAAR